MTALNRLDAGDEKEMFLHLDVMSRLTSRYKNTGTMKMAKIVNGRCCFKAKKILVETSQVRNLAPENPLRYDSSIKNLTFLS